MGIKLIDIIIYGIACGMIIAAISKSSIFERVRVAVKNEFFSELIHCPYCLSYWVGAVFGVYEFWGAGVIISLVNGLAIGFIGNVVCAALLLCIDKYREFH